MADAREALGQSIAAELKIYVDDSWIRACDRVLMRLWIEGYKVVPVEEGEKLEPPYTNANAIPKSGGTPLMGPVEGEQGI